MKTKTVLLDLETSESPECIELPERPGALRGQVWLTLQTIHAQRLFQGRTASGEKPIIVGLVGFANRLRVIWQGARTDDPYADWWLIKIHESIELALKSIQNQQLDLTQKLKIMNALDIDIAVSDRPYRVPLKFANPYAYRGARLLADFDQLVCMALTTRHVGLLDSKACEGLIKASARNIRAIFMIPQGYRLLKIDRDEIRNSIGRSSEARRFMGELPGDVLNGERRAPLLPSKVEFPSGFSTNVTLHPGTTLSVTNSSEEVNDDV